MNRNVIATGSVLAMVAIILGAFGAHGLKNLVDEYHIDIFNKGVQYHFYHALAILILGILSSFKVQVKWPFIFLLLGILFFSGSLYLLSVSNILKINTAWVGPLTPIGGLFYIIGWGLLTRNVLKS